MNNQGFGANGVGKGTPAAQMHSDIGNVNKESGFSNAQSTGARGGDVRFGDGDLVAWWTHIANLGTKNLTKKDVLKILQEFYPEEELRRMFPGEESFDK